MAVAKATRAARPRKPLADRFWEKVKIGQPAECWEWQAKAKHQFGYGRMTNGRGVNLKAHRVAWELANGPVPDGLCVCHSCDNPPCCNPAHLFLGSKRDNTHDMMAKDRWSRPPVRYGEGHHKVTIPDTELRTIRTSNQTTTELARRYGVSYQTIRRIQLGTSRAQS